MAISSLFILAVINALKLSRDEKRLIDGFGNLFNYFGIIWYRPPEVGVYMEYEKQALLHRTRYLANHGSACATQFYTKRFRLSFGWEAFCDDLGGDALSPGTAGGLACPYEDGKGHGAQYHRHLCILEC